MRVRAAIAEQAAARAGGGVPSVADACAWHGRSGTGVRGGAGTVAVYEPVYGTDARAEALTELQVTVGRARIYSRSCRTGRC
jgi:hypothetical protein